MATLVCVALTVATSGCGTANVGSRFEDPAVLVAERDEWRGGEAGPVALRLHVEATVDTRSDPSRAESGLVVHASLTRFGAGGEVAFAVPVPRGSRIAETAARGIATHVTPNIPQGPVAGTGDGGVGAVVVKDARVAIEAGGVAAIDPGQGALKVAVDCADGEVVEVLVRLVVPGTLASDARPVGLVGVPVGEVLYRYDLPSDAVGTFRTSLAGARPVVTEKDGRRLVALYAKRLAPLDGAPARWPIARYVTVSASPKGYDQAFATDWSVATAAYLERLVGVSADLSDGFVVPFKPTATRTDLAIAEALAWVQARTGRPPSEAGDRSEVPWDAARKLPGVIAKNDLTSVDRAHLLAWVLREAGLPFSFLMARRGDRVPLEADLPVPQAFEIPLLSAGGVVLDPGCATCAPGEVRAALAGGQAMALPVRSGTKAATFITLPEPSPKATP